MRFLLLLFTVGAAAISPLYRRQTGGEQTATIDQLFNAISGQSRELSSYLASLDSAEQAYGLGDVSSRVLEAYNLAVNGITPLPGDIYIEDFVTAADDVYAYSQTVDNLADTSINARPVLLAYCAGPVVLRSFNNQLNVATTLLAVTRSKLDQNDPILLSVLDGIASIAIDALSRAINAFADQTFPPFSCSNPTTTTTTSTDITTKDSSTTISTTESSTDVRTTEVSTTEPSTTESSTTESSTTESSATETSTTEVSTTESSTTEISTTQSITTQSSTSSVESTTLSSSSFEITTTTDSTTTSSSSTSLLSTTASSIIDDPETTSTSTSTIQSTTTAVYATSLTTITISSYGTKPSSTGKSKSCRQKNRGVAAS